MEPSQDTPNTTAKVAELRTAVNNPNMPLVEPGFGSLQSFELLHRQAKLLSSSTLVPTQYQQVVVKRDYKGNIKSSTPNENAIPNCMIAMNMAMRMHADPIMVMQNLYIVEGRPSWSSQWIISQINNCGRFSPLRFDIVDLGEKTVPYEYFEWENNERIKKKTDVKIHDYACTAWVKEKGTGDRLTGPKVTIEMAVREGWYTKNGSKWQTMEEVMLRYRSAAFFGKLYAPELLMGIPSQEEVEDVLATLRAGPDGAYAPAPEAAPADEGTNVKDLRRRATDTATDVETKGTAQPQAQAEHEHQGQEGAKTEPPADQTQGGEQQKPASDESKQQKPAEAEMPSDNLFGRQE